MPKVITDIKQITLEWLTKALKLKQGQVKKVWQKAGSSSKAVHLKLRYSPNTPKNIPTRLFLHFKEPGNLIEDKETLFYNSIANVTPNSPTLHCLNATHDPKTGAYHLLLEDVSTTHYTVETQAPTTLAETNQMVDTLARFHAHWWGEPLLGETIGFKIDESLIGNHNTHTLEKLFPAFADFLGDRLSLRRRKIYEELFTHYPRLLTRRMNVENHLTLVHNNAAPCNFLLPKELNQSKTYIVNWQGWGISAGLHDLAHLITLFWYPERRARMEREVVKQYYTQLLAYGVTGYEWDNCWNDYRLFAIRNLLVPLWAWSEQSWSGDHWSQLEKAMIAFVDLECTALFSDS